jgi:FkbM family methyltransferase
MKALSFAKSLAKRLPVGMQAWLKDQVRAHQIRRGTFGSPEPEWAMLGQWIKPGDTVLDIGANKGAYTLRMSELAGDDGSVLAFEPIHVTGLELARTAARSKCRRNITIVHAAVSDHVGSAFMANDGNSYRASIADSGERVRCMTIDSFELPRVNLLKIDVEGHELPALLGARATLLRCKPRLIVECNDRNDHRVDDYLIGLGYKPQVFERSPNTVYS